ncbi:MAG: hypothetical protein AAF629_35590, partial [Chloroflexota bacterium]
KARTPLQMVEAIRNWDRRTGAVKMEQLTIIRVNEEATAQELLNHRELGPMLEPFNNMAVLVPEKFVEDVTRLLREYGYLD